MTDGTVREQFLKVFCSGLRRDYGQDTIHASPSSRPAGSGKSARMNTDESIGVTTPVALVPIGRPAALLAPLPAGIAID